MTFVIFAYIIAVIICPLAASASKLRATFRNKSNVEQRAIGRRRALQHFPSGGIIVFGAP
jgi:hypothetical protein